MLQARELSGYDDGAGTITFLGTDNRNWFSVEWREYDFTKSQAFAEQLAQKLSQCLPLRPQGETQVFLIADTKSPDDVFSVIVGIFRSTIGAKPTRSTSGDVH